MNSQLAYDVAFAKGGPRGTPRREVVQELTRLTNTVHDIVLELSLSPRFSQNDSDLLQ